MRGKVISIFAKRKNTRITPACAGKSRLSTAKPFCIWDHPRVCGEKDSLTVDGKRHLGSPPRVRGKATIAVSRSVRVRITPACAGKSVIIISEGIIMKDHPRVCGEKCSNSEPNNCHLGSPPRVRGKATIAVSRSVRVRITPACAGKSPSDFLPIREIMDHPRVCGEKTKKSP